MHEEKLWSSGVLNVSTPRGLLNAVFYVNGKIFCLRGGKEHRDLKLSQLQRTAGKYTYYENVSKNHNGSFAQLHVQSKVVPLYENPDLGDRCPVFILDKYISRLPAKAKADDIFYARPLDRIPMETDTPWYSAVPIGKNMLQNMVKSMCTEAKIQDSKTNHSLRATAATQMFQNGVPEKVIQARTGHVSVEGLRAYERLSEHQHKAACNLLSSNNQQNSLVPYITSPPVNNTQVVDHRKQLVQQHQSTAMCINTPAQSAPPALNIHDLHGCTITINNNTFTSSYQEKFIDQLFSQVQDY